MTQKVILIRVLDLDLYHSRYPPRDVPTRNIANRIYRTLDETLRMWMEPIMLTKARMGDSREHLAHPPVSDETIKKFLNELGADAPGLDEQQISLFKHLQMNANTTDNVMRAKKRR